jgi:branched-chain amino acid aminotransferase
MGVNINWDELSFSLTVTKEMFLATCKSDGVWDKGEFRPFGNISISPAAGVLNYGQGLFEGLKCQRSREGKLLLFRPLENGKRMAEGARRLCMAEYPPEQFVKAVKETVRRNAEYVPPYGKGSLYIRPCLWGTGAVLGVSPAPEYTFMIYVSPVGAYFKTGFKPGKFVMMSDFHRAAPKGMGGVKAIGNYAATMYPGKLVKAKGYNDCLYLDAREDKYIEEVGSANFFCVKGRTLLTPALGSILPGITRQSVMTLAREKLGLEVREASVSVEEAMAADEAFCTGTATVVSPIGTLVLGERETVYQGGEVGPVTRKVYELLTKIQMGEAKDEWGWVEEV